MLSNSDVARLKQPLRASMRCPQTSTLDTQRKRGNCERRRGFEHGREVAVAGVMMTARKSSETMPDDSDAIYKVDTVPPPPGEDDAYSATTKVGPTAHGFIAQLMARAGNDESAGFISTPSPISQVRGLRSSRPASPSSAPPIVTPCAIVPKVFDDDTDDDRFDPTSLFGAPTSGATVRLAAHDVRSIVEAVERRSIVASQAPVRAAWTMVADLPLAPVLEPAAAPLRPSPKRRLGVEIAIFVAAFLAVSIPALAVRDVSGAHAAARG